MCKSLFRSSLGLVLFLSVPLLVGCDRIPESSSGSKRLGLVNLDPSTNAYRNFQENSVQGIANTNDSVPCTFSSVSLITVNRSFCWSGNRGKACVNSPRFSGPTTTCQEDSINPVQSAIDWVHAQGAPIDQHGVFLDAGEHKVSGHGELGGIFGHTYGIRVPSNTKIQGTYGSRIVWVDGLIEREIAGEKQEMPLDHVVMMTHNLTSPAVGKDPSLTNITLHSFEVDGRDAAMIGVMSFQAYRKVDLKYLTVRRVLRTGIMLGIPSINENTNFPGAWDMTASRVLPFMGSTEDYNEVSDCIIQDVKGEGIGIVGAFVKVERNKVYGNLGSDYNAISAFTGSYNVLIQNNSIVNALSAIALDGSYPVYCRSDMRCTDGALMDSFQRWNGRAGVGQTLGMTKWNTIRWNYIQMPDEPNARGISVYRGFDNVIHANTIIGTKAANQPDRNQVGIHMNESRDGEVEYNWVDRVDIGLMLHTNGLGGYSAKPDRPGSEGSSYIHVHHNTFMNMADAVRVHEGYTKLIGFDWEAPIYTWTGRNHNNYIHDNSFQPNVQGCTMWDPILRVPRQFASNNAGPATCNFNPNAHSSVLGPSP